MVRPTTFGFDEQTGQTNAFQTHMDLSQQEVQERALKEFDAAVAKLRAQGITVVVFEDTDPRPKPNAVFPNNWLSMWPDGQVYLYPMATESRRIERSEGALQALQKEFIISDISDLSSSEQQNEYLESTGVMIFDHVYKYVYGCISPRCDERLFLEHAHVLGYEPVLFRAYDQNGTAIYHTNVLMGVQSTTAVVCAEAITDPTERALVLATLEHTGHEIVEITQAQMAAFAGNVLEVRNPAGKRFLVLSQTAYDALTQEQRAVLQQDKTLLPINIPTIETIGGGSARCMLAEIFLPPRQ